MRAARLSPTVAALIASAVCACALSSKAFAAKEKIVYAFSGADGAVPYSALLAGPGGNLFGTTFYGGANGLGTAFELVPRGNKFREQVLFSFPGGSSGGSGPAGGLAIGPSGSLWGTTEFGSGSAGAGIAFALYPAYPEYSLTTLLSFGAQSPYGSYSLATPVVIGGNLYATASQGGQYGDGTVFGPFGIHPFGSKTDDGITPMAGVVVDASGNVFGTTQSGGGQYANCTLGCGTVYMVTAAAKESVLYGFKGSPDGANPQAALIMDDHGALYGTTAYGGVYNNGTVFKLTRKKSAYTEKVLYSFQSGYDGTHPVAGLVMAGNLLFGTTQSGGLYDKGTVFELSLSGGKWSEIVLHNFQGGNDGATPLAGLLIQNGALFGTTSAGGQHGAGTVFEVKT